MKRFWFKLSRLALAVFAVGMIMFFGAGQVAASGEAQTGVFATVIYEEQINVRGGPSTVYYPIVGTAYPGDVIPALGVSPGREWVQISLPSGRVGWVYATFVSLSGELPIVEPPPTQTPIATATINPTFAAAFISQPTSTRMPTFTPPSPLEIPKYADIVTRSSGISLGTVVIGLLVIGAFVYLFSAILNRQ